LQQTEKVLIGRQDSRNKNVITSIDARWIASKQLKRAWRIKQQQGFNE